MKGILWKWTNYWNGWQPRWFILENGILSYYQSEDDVTQGCKGSVSLSACDISVHPTDNLRLDIVIPGEQHIYVRAASTLERQQWLVALGSEKAQGANSRKGLRSESSPDAIKAKKSELRLYCDLLMQQVHSIKEAATAENGPNVQKLDECTSLLSATCETFIKTLEDCARITDAATSKLPAQSLHHHLPVVPTTTISSSNASKLAGAGVNVNGNSASAAAASRERIKSITHSNSN